MTPISGYESYVQVRFAECDPMGHVNNAVYLNYLEQLAIDHSEAVGWTTPALLEESRSLFVARKHEIEYLRPAFNRDWLRIRTWPLTMTGARGTRYYEITRLEAQPEGLPGRLLRPEELVPSDKRELIVRASTEWAFMNIDTGRPTRIPASVAKSFVSE